MIFPRFEKKKALIERNIKFAVMGWNFTQVILMFQTSGSKLVFLSIVGMRTDLKGSLVRVLFLLAKYVLRTYFNINKDLRASHLSSVNSRQILLSKDRSANFDTPINLGDRSSKFTRGTSGYDSNAFGVRIYCSLFRIPGVIISSLVLL